LGNLKKTGGTYYSEAKGRTKKKAKIRTAKGRGAIRLREKGVEYSDPGDTIPEKRRKPFYLHGKKKSR